LLQIKENNDFVIFDEKMIVNPYDYINPIKTERYFADRKNELKEIEYILNLAKGRKYFNIAILGERRVGKTSLLNIIKKNAVKRNLIVASFKLDEESANMLDVFKQMEEKIIIEGAKKGFYREWDKVFLRVVEGIKTVTEITASISGIPLQLPNLYKAKKSQKDFDVSYTILENDFKKLWDHVSMKVDAIIIIIDEAQLLAREKALLQRIRNLFEDLDGYILILSGTPLMLQDLSEVFSPIERFFVKLPLGAFKNEEDAKEAILKPIKDVDIEFDKDSIEEIVRVSGRYPYEINLLGHFAFKVSSEREWEKIKLTPEVWNSIRKQIKKMQEYESIFSQLSSTEQEFLKIFVNTGHEIDYAALTEYLRENNLKPISQSYFSILAKKDIMEVSKKVGKRVFYKIKDNWLEFYIRYGIKQL